MAEFFFQSFFVFLCNSFLFDCLHFYLHRANSAWHQTHHLFFDRQLRINHAYQKKNMMRHVFVEFSVKLLSCFIFLAWFSWQSIMFVALIEMAIFIYVLLYRGEDHNHRMNTQLARTLRRPHITADYHALHHQYPKAFFSSHHHLFDCLFGTACLIKDRTFLVTGSDGAFGKAMVEALRKKGGIVYEWLPNSTAWQAFYKSMSSYPLHEIDVLVLAHGSKWTQTQEKNVNSQKQLIHFFLKVKKNHKILPEIWGVGSELEFCSHLNIETIQNYVLSKRAFARFAQRLYADRRLLYRHIVPSSFTSKMGRGLMSAKFTVRIALFLILRGARYVPVSYTGIAYINYLHFISR